MVPCQKFLNFLILFLDKLNQEKVSMMEKDPFEISKSMNLRRSQNTHFFQGS